MVVKILGIIDIFSAIIIIFSIYNLHWAVNLIHGGILLGKGAMSLTADPIGMVYGIVDIVASMFIFFAVEGFMEVKIILFIILVFKGAFSLV